MGIGQIFMMAVLLVLGFVSGLSRVAAAEEMVRPGEVWRDTAGQVIQAHGGGILRVGAEWYWFGEDRTPVVAGGLDPAKRYVSCYRSRDLVHWESRGRVLELGEPEDIKAKFGGDWILERPKVFWVAKTKRYVMYFHADAGYKAAEVGVAVSEKVDGPYRFVKHFRPLGQESRDIGQFVDDDGANYLIFESRPTKGFYIARLTEDGMDVTETAFVKAPLEGGALVRYEGLYYVIGSHMTGWKPNPNVYATAKALKGPWSEFRELAPGSADTWGSQSSMLLKVTGAGATGAKTTVIYVGDLWKPKELWDSRYVWMPVEIGGGAMRVPKPEAWGVDVGAGVVRRSGAAAR